ncbi:serine/threonine-protein kinase [Streptomyces sp. ISL-11]|uniref:serine/threonine-protein kinase n=1 Tax=Streptomyces sp. ISL-11 TaxID=2819174 RepID=UPI001BE95D96|nr:serine/threonine-protein kinase [Streptomyces sp. ISL-11]MBT2385424.1 serine/threonine protein kinase [Streptomyces sp. ISL-11]
MENLDGLRPEDPRTLGAYRLLGRLGSGGMGRVYLARSDRGRTVAVKLVHTELAGQEEFRRRFRAEVRAARQVGGEWTAPVLDADTEAEIPWVATGYIAGPSLRQVVDHDFGPLPERSVRILGAGLARSLEAIHAAGVVHRDLKPSNVLITLDGPRVIDFGIARALETVTDGGDLTRTGAAVGSPGFMSPEQVRGARVTPASDVFCLGSVLAYAATGRMPFGTADSGVHALMYRIAEEEPDLSDVPASLRPLIVAFLAKDPAERPTPAQVLERTGVEELLGDLRSADPWLPGGLVARLGRHAVQLLDVEEPVGTPGPMPPERTAPAPMPEPTLIVRQDPPTMTAGHPVGAPLPPPAPVYGYPHAGPYGGNPYGTGTHTINPYGPAPRRSRTPVVLAAVVAGGLLAGGGTVFLLNKQQNDKSGGTQAGSAPSASAPQNSVPTPQSATPSPGGATAGAGPGAVPQGFLGTWQSDFSTDAGSHSRSVTLRQGPLGTTVADISGSGTDKDGLAYRCAWTADLTGGGEAGTPLHLGPSRVTLAQPAADCQPGPRSELTLLSDGGMRRELVGKAEAPLTYRKVG